MSSFVAPQPNIRRILDDADRTIGRGQKAALGKGFWTAIAIIAAIVLFGVVLVSMRPVASAAVTGVVTSNTQQVEGFLGTVDTALDPEAAPEEQAAAQTEAAGILTDFANFVNSMNATANTALDGAVG